MPFSRHTRNGPERHGSFRGKESQAGNVLLRYLLPLVIFVALVGALLLVSPRTGQKIQATFLQMITPFFKTGSGVSEGIQNVTRGLKTLEELEDEVEVLRVENKELRATNQLLRDLEEENNKLRSALEFQRRSVYRLLTAQVIRRDPSTWWSTIQIDRGSQDGVIAEMPVLTDRGLVGKIATVAPNTSTVLLLVDESCRVAATVEGTNEQGILSGLRTSNEVMPTLMLRFLPKSAEIRPGQKVLSSGVGTVFPPGITLGTIKTFRVAPLNAEAEVVPAVDFSALNDVFVVVGRK